MPVFATSYMILSLISPLQTFLETEIIHSDHQFQELINQFCLITPTQVTTDLQQLLAQINGSWQNSNNAE